MAGKYTSMAKLNTTLTQITSMLYSISGVSWFVGYGTLLGVVRNGSCIDGDDDIDIMIDRAFVPEIKQKLDMLGIELQINHSGILKTRETDLFASVDFYCCYVDGATFTDPWERAIWLECRDQYGNIPTASFGNHVVNIPFGATSKLEARYGDWKTPANTKLGGTSPRKLK